MAHEQSSRHGRPPATGAIGLCRFGSPACVVENAFHNGFPPPTDVTIIRNTCDTWPYGDGV